MSTPSRVIITGGAGFIGSHLVERLLADGKAVAVIDDFSTGSEANLQNVRSEPRLHVIASRVSQCPNLQTLVNESESIYHLASVVGVDLVMQSGIQTIETNVSETREILSVAASSRVPVLFTSTSEVYGKSSKEVFSETDDLIIGPPHLIRWGYACSKLLDEFLALAFARERRLPVVIARLFNTVGPRQTGRYGMVLPRFIEAAKTGRPLTVYGTGRQTRCFCYVQDAVEALVRLQNHPQARGEVFNVGGNEEVSILQLAETVIRTVGSASPIELAPYEKVHPSGFEDMIRRKPCIEKLAGITGFQPRTPLREIIEKTAGL